MNKMLKLTKVCKINDMAESFFRGEDVLIKRSDVAIQNNDYFLQFEFDSVKKEKKKVKLETGTFNIEMSMQGLVFIPVQIQSPNLLETNSAYKNIQTEFENFFNRLNVYDELEILKKRGVLLYGPPGAGKTSSASKAINKMLENKDTAVVMWNASSIDSSTVLDLFSTGIEYAPEVKKLVVVIEDIGMSVEHYGGSLEVDRSLLNLLDGASSTIQIPTFFVATTNYAHNLPEPLLRPGRFDAWLEIGLPTPDERVKLCEFFSKKELSEDEQKIIKSSDLSEFSVAHVKELVLRCVRDGKTYAEVVGELKDLRKRFKGSFNPKQSFGLL